MAGEALTPTSYIQHHLKNFTFQVGEGGFWAINVDTLVTAVLMGLLIVYAVMSLVQARSPLSSVITRLCEPILRPFRRMIPLVGGIDLSPLPLQVLLQVAMIVLGHLQAGMLR